MIRSSMLAGMSVVAFAATAAGAQTTRTNGDTTDPNTRNRVVVSCTAGNNTCSVTQNAGTFDSTGSSNASGTNNEVDVNQRGNRLFAESRATGSNNASFVTQGGFNNTSAVSQTGTRVGALPDFLANFAQISQGNQSNGTGSANQGTIVQVRPDGAANTQFGNNSFIRQATVSGGSNNTATSTQNGTSLLSSISQTDEEIPAGRTANNTAIAATGIATSNNSATVLQVGRGGVASTGTESRINQRQSGNTANVSLFDGGQTTNAQGGSARNYSAVAQYNSLFTTGANNTGFAAAGGGNTLTTANSPNTGNSVVVAITGQQNTSTVQQNGVQNTADVSILGGGTGNTAAADSGTNPGTGASLLPNQGGQPNNRSQGNGSMILQTGRGNYAAVSSGGRVRRSDGTMSGGAGNISNITQSQGDVAVTATTLNSAQSAGAAHRALVYQRGTLDVVTINQSNNALGGAGRNATQSGSVADVSQLSFNSTTTITQQGTNFAQVDQGSNRESSSADNNVNVEQEDAGDITTTTGANPGSGFGGGSAGTTSGSSRNTAIVAQNGIGNFSIVRQNAINASATLFQAVGTRLGTAEIRQGVSLTFGGVSDEQNNASLAAANNGAGTRNVTASVSLTGGQEGRGLVTGPNGTQQGTGGAIAQSGRNLFASITQQGGTPTPAGTSTGGTNSNNSARIAQANDRNSATVSQNGTNLIVLVEQRGGAATAGAGAGGGASAATGTGFNNLVTVTQTNDNNQALARQTAGVGNSDANGATSGVPNDVNFPFSRSGAASAEIVISQSGTGGSATVEQRGRGQYASITQSGTNNVGGILQNAGATNAVAVLTQNGTNNTYYITQDTAGQYIRVTQSGTGNTAAGTSIINGPSGNGNSNPDPQARPAFGGVQ